MSGETKDKVADAVEAEVVEGTALAIREDVAKVSQDVMKDEIEASHLQNIGMMAIENAIDEDKAEYEAQLEQIRAAVEVAQEDLKKAQQARDKEIKRFQSQLIRTELRKKRSNALKVLAKLTDLSVPFRIPSDEDEKGFGVSYHEPDPNAEKSLERAGFIKWEFQLKQEKLSSYRDGVMFSGTRGLSRKCTEALKAVKAAEDEVKKLSALNRDVRIQIQNLEKERRELQRKLRQQIVSKSVVGNEIERMLKASRKKVKALPLPAKYQK